MQRTGEFVLGLVGGIIGLIFSAIALFIGSLANALTGTVSVYLYAILAILASVGGIVGGILVRTNAITGGWIMIVSAILGFIAIEWYYLVSTILLLIGGIMSVFRKEKPTISQ